MTPEETPATTPQGTTPEEMMITRLLPIAFGALSTDPTGDRAAVERDLSFKLPEALCSLLLTVKATVVFEKEVKFKPNQRTFLEDADGFHALEMLYGLSADKTGLRHKNRIYIDQIPPGSLTIGQTAGGNQVCLMRDTGSVVFWHHEAAEGEGVFAIADNFDEFLAKLVVVDAAKVSPKTKGIIKGKSFLKF